MSASSSYPPCEFTDDVNMKDGVVLDEDAWSCKLCVALTFFRIALQRACGNKSADSDAELEWGDAHVQKETSFCP